MGEFKMTIRGRVAAFAGYVMLWFGAIVMVLATGAFLITAVGGVVAGVAHPGDAEVLAGTFGIILLSGAMVFLGHFLLDSVEFG